MSVASRASDKFCGQVPQIFLSPFGQEDLLAPAVTVGETEGAMDSTSGFFGLFFCL